MQIKEADCCSVCITHKERSPKSFQQNSTIEYNAFFTPHLVNGPEVSQIQGRSAAILLNNDLPSYWVAVWNTVDYRVCADGGANRLYSAIMESMQDQTLPDRQTEAFDTSQDPISDQHALRFPDAVVGDFDSIDSHVQDFFSKTEGVCVRHVSDQDTTDLEKALEQCKDASVIYLLGPLSDRLDHTVMSASAAAKYMENNPGTIVFLMAEHTLGVPVSSCSRLKIQIEVHDISQRGMGCSLLPVFGHCCVTTEGLQWDVSEQQLSMLGLVSSSNRIPYPMPSSENSGSSVSAILDVLEGRVLFCVHPGINEPRK